MYCTCIDMSKAGTQRTLGGRIPGRGTGKERTSGRALVVGLRLGGGVRCQRERSPGLPYSKITPPGQASIIFPPVVTRCHCRKKSDQKTDLRQRDINVLDLKQVVALATGSHERTSFFMDCGF